MPEGTVEQTTAPTTIQSAIDLAKQDLSLGDKKVADAAVPEKKETKETKETQTEVETDDLSAEELETAKGLMKALKDPAQAPAVIDWLAKEAGYTKAEIREIKEDLVDGTKKEKAEAVDEITQLFTEQFGEEFAAKLAPAIKRAVEKGVAEKVKPLEESNQQQQLSRLQQEASTVIDKIANEFYEKGDMPKVVSAEMSRLIDKYPPSKGQSQSDYLRDIHAMAAALKGGSLKPVDAGKSSRVERNRSDVSSRLGTNGRSPSPSGSSIADEFAHIKDPLSKAIATAKANLDKETRQ